MNFILFIFGQNFPSQVPHILFNGWSLKFKVDGPIRTQSKFLDCVSEFFIACVWARPGIWLSELFLFLFLSCSFMPSKTPFWVIKLMNFEWGGSGSGKMLTNCIGRVRHVWVGSRGGQSRVLDSFRHEKQIPPLPGALAVLRGMPHNPHMPPHTVSKHQPQSN